MSKPSLRTVFRLLVVAELVVPLIAVGYESAVFSSLHEDEQTVMQWSGHGSIIPDTTGEESAGIPPFIGIGVIALCLAVLAAQVGLFFFRSWARTWWTIMHAVIMPVTLLTGWTISLPFSQLCHDVSMMISGAMLALCYASPLASVFRGAPPGVGATQPT